MRQAFRSVRGVLEAQGLHTLQERLYIAPGATRGVLDLREEAFRGSAAAALPSPTVLVNRPCMDVPCAGLHYLALEPTPSVGVQELESTEASPGRLVTWQSGRAVFLPSDSRADSGGSLQSMFERCGERLRDQGMTLRDVARTWLYLRDLLDDYDELNQVRDRFFTEHGLGTPGQFECPPASTGIQGFHPDDRKSFMETLAVKIDGEQRAFRTIQPKLQCEAWDYGSTFSRGMVIDLADSSLTSLSGTASIGTDGKTMHVGQSRKQLEQTLKSFEDLLETCDKGPRIPGLWTLYFKNEETWVAWEEGVRSGRYEPIAAPAIYADVCRDNLLFEMELTFPT